MAENIVSKETLIDSLSKSAIPVGSVLEIMNTLFKKENNDE